MTRTLPTVLTGLIVGVLWSISGVGSSRFHFLPAFIVISGFVIAIGLLVNIGCDKFSAWRRGKQQDKISN